MRKGGVTADEIAAGHAPPYPITGLPANLPEMPFHMAASSKVFFLCLTLNAGRLNLMTKSRIKDRWIAYVNYIEYEESPNKVRTNSE